MKGFLTTEQVAEIKKAYPVGTRIELDHMEGERDMQGGLQGVVKHVDDQGQLHMAWQNGRSLALVVNEDSFHVLPPVEEETAKNEVPDSKVDRFVDYINANVLPKINYEQLQASYATEEKAYAKSVLNALHTAAVEIYGTDCFEDSGELDYVLLPGIIQSKANGNLCVGLLEIDLLSSGEHCGTDFLTRYGCINQSDPEMPDEVRKFLRGTYGSYDYCYTATLENDIHVSKAHLPEKMREVLEHFMAYEFIPCGPRHVIGNVNDRPDFSQNEDDMER